MLRERISRYFLEAESEEPLILRLPRMIGGATYGFLAGLAYGLTVGTINALLLRDLPIQIEWIPSIVTGVVLGFILALIGILTGWFTERGMGVLVGSLATAVVGLAVQLLVVGVGPIGLLMLVVLALPISVISLPIAFFMRWLSDHHREIQLEVKQPWKRAGGFLLLVIGALVLGMIPGYFQRWGVREERSARLVHTALQFAATDPLQAKRLPLETLPGLKEHLGAPHTLRVTKSKISTVGYDVHVVFDDGYAITCVTVAYSLTPYMSSCVLGEEITSHR